MTATLGGPPTLETAFSCCRVDLSQCSTGSAEVIQRGHSPMETNLLDDFKFVPDFRHRVARDLREQQIFSMSL